ncbi:sigma-70 family RNA polymerase sigma factor [Verrucomicrobia bacterium S94]|nr:sigma-70 family RNA polymerase sigma factor [Verrucomicrobia bacterium S94]
MRDDDTLDFDLLVREHHAGLRAFIRALGVDETWVDDMAQEVFIVAFRKRSEFRKEEDFGKWLRGIARRQVMGERTKTARRHRIMHEGITDILLSLGIEKHEPEPNRELMVNTMKNCVGKLNEPQRELLRCRYEEGRRCKELAAEFSSTASAIRKQLQRIRTAVRKCMEQSAGETA